LWISVLLSGGGEKNIPTLKNSLGLDAIFKLKINNMNHIMGRKKLPDSSKSVLFDSLLRFNNLNILRYGVP
jgi:hypothetical protein